MSKTEKVKDKVLGLIKRHPRKKSVTTRILNFAIICFTGGLLTLFYALSTNNPTAQFISTIAVGIGFFMLVIDAIT